MHYRSNICKCSCPRHCDDLRDWCRPCRDEWERRQEEQAELRRLGDAWHADEAIRPASAEEWARYWDEAAPTIEELVS